MSGEKVLIIDGTPEGDSTLPPSLAMLQEVIEAEGAKVNTFTLRNIRMAHCIGCFSCWVDTPGVCIHDDAGRVLTAELLASDTIILFTPVTFGGYSSMLKKAVERRLPLVLPFFCKVHGETDHLPRYAHAPRLVCIGMQRRPDPAEAEIFRILAGRNALSSHAKCFAVEVIPTDASAEEQRQRMHASLTRHDPLPFGKAASAIMPHPVAATGALLDGPSGKHALLVIGSPKTRSASTSAVLGRFVLDYLKEQGWETESLKLAPVTLRQEGETTFLAAVDRADLLILSFPLYNDSLPFLATHALESIHRHRTGASPRRLSMVAIANNGYPEPEQNAPALAICRQFALQSGIAWAGCLAVGAGEAISSGEPLLPHGGGGRAPAAHVLQALELAAKALADGKPVPEQAQRALDKSPIPFVPFALWTWLFGKLGARYWRRRAAAHGVGTKELFAKPNNRKRNP